MTTENIADSFINLFHQTTAGHLHYS